MKKSIMILGAGIYQVPLIECAKAMGLHTVVCSIEGNYPGFAIADEIRYVNTTDCEACLKVAMEFDVAGVCTAGTDVALPAIGRICDTLGLSGPSERSAILASNKRMMKEAFAAAGVCTARFRVVTSIDECRNAAREIGYPCILKVCDSSGSRGICVVRREDDLEQAYAKVLPFTRLPYILVEEFLDGEEMGAQAFVMNGKLLMTMPHGDYVHHGNTGVPVGHYTPYDGADIDAIARETEKTIHALGIDNAAVNIDFILVNGKPNVLEIGARAGATCLSEMVSLHYGIDYYRMIIECALGIVPQDIARFDAPLSERKAVVAKLITSDRTGTLASYRMPEPDANLAEWHMDCPIGHKVNAFNIGPDRIGQVICTGRTVNEAEAICDKAIYETALEVTE